MFICVVCPLFLAIILLHYIGLHFLGPHARVNSFDQLFVSRENFVVLETDHVITSLRPISVLIDLWHSDWQWSKCWLLSVTTGRDPLANQWWISRRCKKENIHFFESLGFRVIYDHNITPWLICLIWIDRKIQ